MAKVRVGLIGCGFIGRFHSWGIRGAIKLGLVDAEYVGACDVQEERAREFAGIFGAPFVTTDAREIIASPEINAVYVCTPTVHHKELVLATVAAGKHVFCEKPLAADLADVREMCAAVQRAGVVHQVGLVLRHSPIFTVLKSLTEDPSLGRPMAVIFRDDQFFPVGGHYASTWRADHRQAGRGTLLEHSIHDMDLLRWLCGEPVLLRAETRFFSGREMVEDLGTVLGSERVAALASSTAVPPDFWVEVVVVRFEAGIDGSAQLTARWAVRNAARKIVRVRQSQHARQAAAATTEGGVKALSAALGDLADEIATVLREIQAER